MKKDSFYLNSIDDTENFARKLAPFLKAGHVIYLSGDLGAGKTCFARFLIQTLSGKSIDVPSPTFTLVQNYESANFLIWHFDLYRINDPEEVFELGWDEIHSGLAIVEWPDKLGFLKDRQGNSIWNINFQLAGDSRRLVTIEGPEYKELSSDG